MKRLSLYAIIVMVFVLSVVMTGCGGVKADGAKHPPRLMKVPARGRMFNYYGCDVVIAGDFSGDAFGRLPPKKPSEQYIIIVVSEKEALPYIRYKGKEYKDVLEFKVSGNYGHLLIMPKSFRLEGAIEFGLRVRGQPNRDKQDESEQGPI